MMKKFIENILHHHVEISPYQDLMKLPLIFQGSYNLFILTINGQRCVLAEPKEELGLATLRKHYRRLEQLTEQYCVFYLKKMNTYLREKMLEEGISFIWEDHQMYMPFLGILLKQNDTRVIKPCNKLSFLTQKLLLMALYERWQNVTVTLAAERLNVSKMSITRCYDEIEYMEIPILHKRGRMRLLCGDTDKKQMWNIIRPYMRTPLIQEFYLDEDIPQILIKSGMSALCEYSMLNDNEYMTYAIVKSQLEELEIRNKKQVPKGEKPKCIVQELGYLIDYKDLGVIDPFSVFMLMEEVQQEPRVDKALEEMLREYVW